MAPNATRGVELVLLRHGETQWNREGRFTSFTDVALHDDARAVLEQTAATLRGMTIDRVLVSPLRRARETERILREFGAFGRAPAAVCEALREVGFGVFEGATKQELGSGPRAREFERWFAGDASPAAPSGEAWDSVAARVDRFLEERSAESGTTVVVAHGYLLKAVAARAFGLRASAVRTLRWPNGAVLRLRLAANGWQLDGELDSWLGDQLKDRR
ncbi:histidine phosphatase family protein [Parafrigoribacterium soli]|uniref:histidine phosphatase family protein n=1 Tax=Parafrigoribacterium soli TaxID=3144663 RepID=UPI0032EE2740